MYKVKMKKKGKKIEKLREILSFSIPLQINMLHQRSRYKTRTGTKCYVCPHSKPNNSTKTFLIHNERYIIQWH